MVHRAIEKVYRDNAKADHMYRSWFSRRRLGDAKASRRLPNGGVLPATPFLRMASPCAERRRQGVGWTPRRPPKSKAGPRGEKSKRAAGPLARAGEKAGILRAGRVRDLRAREGRGRAREKGAARAGNRAYTPAQACPIAAGLQRARGKRGEGEEKRACCRPADLSLLLLLHATTPPRPPPALRPSADWSLSVHQLELALCPSADWKPADRRL